jgi:hypothetical protein
MNHHSPRGRVVDRRPRRQLSDSYYLVLAAMGLLQVPRTVEASGIVSGILSTIVIILGSILIAVGNKGRFMPMLNNRFKDK